MKIEAGARCRLKTGPLGMLAHPDALRFEPETTRSGDLATYFQPHPTLDGWHILLGIGRVEDSLDQNQRPLFVPAADCHFEVLA